MTLLRPRSLRWRLVGRLVLLQATVLSALIVLVLLVVAALWWSGVLGEDYEGSSLDVPKEAVERDAGGGLTLRPTPDLANLRSEISGLLFVVRAAQGRRLSEGGVPPDFVSIAGALDHVREARLSWTAGQT